eukprot:COSAG01_NODE_39294_length_478_cov_1.358839_1_plen_76_part_01
MRLDLALALIGGATVVAGQDKKPGKISGSGIYFTKVGTQVRDSRRCVPRVGSPWERERVASRCRVGGWRPGVGPVI